MHACFYLLIDLHMLGHTQAEDMQPQVRLLCFERVYVLHL